MCYLYEEYETPVDDIEFPWHYLADDEPGVFLLRGFWFGQSSPMSTAVFRRRKRAENGPVSPSSAPWVYSACAVILLATSAALAQRPSETPSPVSITITLDDNYPPYAFRDASGKFQGIRKDTWELWSRKTGIQVRLEAEDWALALARMAAGRADVIDTIFKTEARTREYDFSGPYANIEVPIYFDQSISGISK